MTRAKPFPESDVKCRPMEIALLIVPVFVLVLYSSVDSGSQGKDYWFSKTRKFIKTQDVISEDSKGRIEIYTLFDTK